MNRFSFYMAIGMLAAGGMFAGCSNDDEAPYPSPTPQPEEEPFVLKQRQDIVLNSLQKDGLIAQNDFAFRLFNIDVASTDKNSLLSPLSITQCISMAANGASEEVRDEIVGNFLPNGGSLDELNTLNQYLVESLTDVDNSSTLTLANSAWVDKDYKILSPFADSIKGFYNAESSELDFSSPKAVDKINGWVSETTKGLIPTIFDFLSSDTKFLLINTMYFNGKWFSPFMKELTNKSVFNNEDGKAVEVEFMNQIGRLDYVITSDYSVAQLPYGNRAFSFYAVLPAEGQSLELTSEKWSNLKKEMDGGKVVISMPKFETRYEVKDIEGKMENVGISKLFNTPGALVNTVSPEFPTGKVKMIHKTVFKVDESGAEGAGLTGIGLVETASGEEVSSKSPEIILNRPFIYIVEEQSTGAILFIGAVRNF